MVAEAKIDTQSAYCEDLLTKAYIQVFYVPASVVPISLILELVTVAIEALPYFLKLCGVSSIIHNCEQNTLVARLEARRILTHHGLWKRRDNNELLDVLLHAGANFNPTIWEQLK